MANIVRRDRVGYMERDLGSLWRAVDRWFDEPFFQRPARRATAGLLPLDVSEEDGKLVVRASLPGFTRDEIELQVRDGVLSIAAQHEAEHEQEGTRYYRRERRNGTVGRRISLSSAYADGEVEAELKDGVLTISVPQSEAMQPKQIEIKAA